MSAKLQENFDKLVEAFPDGYGGASFKKTKKNILAVYNDKEASLGLPVSRRTYTKEELEVAARDVVYKLRRK